MLVGAAAAAALLAMPSAAHATIAHGQTCNGATTFGGGTSVSCTWSGSSTAGNLLVAVLVEGVATYVTPTTDGSGWTLGATEDRNNLHVRVYYNANASARSGLISWTFASSVNASLMITEYNGMLTASPADTSSTNRNSAFATSSTASTGSTATLAQGDEVAVVAFAVLNSATSIGSASGFSRVATQAATAGSNSVNAVLDEAIVVNSTTAQSASSTLGASSTWIGAVQTFKVSTKTFNASSSTNWNTAANWTPSGVPTSSDTVILNGTAGSNNLVINANADVNDFYVRSGYAGAVSASSGVTIRVRGDLVLGGSNGSSFTPNALTRISGVFNRSGSTTFAGNSGRVLLESTSSQSHTFGSQSFYDLVFNDGLVGYWRLDDSGSTATDSSGYGHNLTLNGTAAFTSSAATGLAHANTGALSLDGSSGGYASVASTTDLQLTGDITVAFWVKRGGTTSDWTRMVGKGDATVRNYGVWTGPSNSYKVLFQQYNSSGSSVLDLSSTSALAVGTWAHVAATVSGSAATVYVNGVAEATATRSGTPGSSSSDPLSLGYGAPHTYFNGSLDDVRVYKRALTAGEIAAMAHGFAPGTGSATHTLSALTVTHDLTVAAGTISNGTAAVTLGGSLYNFGGVFSLGSGTFSLNGTGTSNVLWSGSEHLNNLTVSGTGTWTLKDRLLVDGTLTQSAAGTLTTASGGANVVATTISKTAGTLNGTGTVVMRSTTTQAPAVNTAAAASLRIESTLESGLVGYWKFDDGNGTTAADWSGNGYSGTMTNGATWSTSAASTSFDNAGALSLDGTDDYVSVTSNSNLQITGDMTISFWVNRAATTSDWARLVGKGSSTVRNYGVWLPSGSSPTVLFQQYTSAGAAVLNLSSTTALSTLGSWYHVVCRMSGSTATIFINGTQDASGTRSGTPGTSTDAFTIGYAPSVGTYFNGKLDDVRVYTRALSASEITSLAAGRYAGSVAPGTYTLGANLAVTGDLVVDNGVLDVSASGCSSASCSVSATGSFINRGTFTSRTGTVTLNGTGSSNSLITNGSHLYNLSIGTSGTWTMGDALNVDSTLTMTSGTIDQSSSNYTIYAANTNKTGGTITGSGSLVLNASTPKTLVLDSAAVGSVEVGAQSTSGLVGYWKLDEAAGGSIVDSSGNGNTGTLYGSYAWLTSSLPTLQFSNTAGLDMVGTTGTYAQLGITNMPNNNASQSITLWFKYTSTASFQNMVALVAPASSSAVQIGLRSGVLLAWKWGGTALASVTAPTDGLWHHLAYTFDGTTHTLYVDGVAGSVTTTAPQTAAVTAAYIGTYDGGSELYAGKLDEIRIYSRALSAAEVGGLAAGSYYDTLTGTTYTLGAALSTTGDLKILGGGLDVSTAGCSSASCAVSVGGSWINYGTFTPRTGTVTLNGTATGKSIISSKYHFNNLTISGSGGGWTLGDRLWVDGALTMTNGTLSQSSSNYNITANTVSQTGGTLSGSGTMIVQSRAANTLTLSSSTISNLRIESTAETNLVGYWKGDNGRGSTLTDHSGQGNTGTLSSSAAWYNALLPSIGFDNYSAVSMEGNAYVTLGVTGFPALNAAQTIAFWAKFDSSTASQTMVGVLNGTTSGIQVGLTGGLVKVWKYGGGDLASATALTDGLWHHYAYTLSGTTHSLYVDGGTPTTTTQTAPTGTPTVAYIGTYNGANELFDGQIDDLRIYKAALTSTQISGLANGRYSGVGGGATFTLGAALNVPGTLAIDNGTLNTSSYTVQTATSDATKGTYVNAGTLQVGSGTVTVNGGLVVQPQGTVTQNTTGGSIRPGVGKSLQYYDTAGTIEGFPTASFDWTNFSFWREYVIYRGFSTGIDRLLARSVDGATMYYWDLASTTYGNLLGTPRWTMEGTNHYVYLVTALGNVFKVQDTGSAFSTVTGWPYRNGTSATATSPLANDASNVYWCGNDGTGNKKMFSLTINKVLNSTRTVVADVTAAPSLATFSSTNYLLVGTTNRIYRTPLDVSSELTSTQPTTTVNGRIIASNGNNMVMFPEDNGKVWGLLGTTLATSWSYQDTDATRHPGGCTAASQCTVKNIYYDPAYGEVYYGDKDGHVYAITSGTLATGYPWRPGTSSDVFQTAPLYRNGVIMIGTAAGKVYEIDRNNGTGPALTRTYDVASAVSSVSFNSSANGSTGAYTIGTQDGKLYYLVAGTDPTPSSR